MIKKIGMCFILISLVACVFCGSVFASSEVADGGGSSGGVDSDFVFPSAESLYNIFVLKYPNSGATVEHFKYVAYVKMDGVNPNCYFVTQDKELQAYENSDGSSLWISAKEFLGNVFYFSYTYKNGKYEIEPCGGKKALEFSPSLRGNIIANHQMPYRLHDGTTGFFPQPQWTIQGVVKPLLPMITTTSFQNFSISSKVGLIVLASLLGIISIRRYLQSTV